MSCFHSKYVWFSIDQLFGEDIAYSDMKGTKTEQVRTSALSTIGWDICETMKKSEWNNETTKKSEGNNETLQRSYEGEQSPTWSGPIFVTSINLSFIHVI